MQFPPNCYFLKLNSKQLIHNIVDKIENKMTLLMDFLRYIIPEGLYWSSEDDAIIKSSTSKEYKLEELRLRRLQLEQVPLI